MDNKRMTRWPKMGIDLALGHKVETALIEVVRERPSLYGFKPEILFFEGELQKPPAGSMPYGAVLGPDKGRDLNGDRVGRPFRVMLSREAMSKMPLQELLLDVLAVVVAVGRDHAIDRGSAAYRRNLHRNHGGSLTT